MRLKCLWQQTLDFIEGREIGKAGKALGKVSLGTSFCLKHLEALPCKENSESKHRQRNGADFLHLDDDLDEDENHVAAKQQRAARADGPKYQGSLVRN